MAFGFLSADQHFRLIFAVALIPDAHIPLVLVVMNLSYALSAYPVGVLSDRVNRKMLLILGLNALIYLGLALSQTSWQVWSLIATYGLYMGMTQCVLLAMVADRVPEHLRGTAFGFLNLLVGIAVLPASLLAGWLWQPVSPEAAFLVGRKKKGSKSRDKAGLLVARVHERVSNVRTDYLHKLSRKLSNAQIDCSSIGNSFELNLAENWASDGTMFINGELVINMSDAADESDESYYNGELIRQPRQITLAEQLELLDTHPIFTGRCPNCEMPFPKDYQPFVHWDCPFCSWKYESI